MKKIIKYISEKERNEILQKEILNRLTAVEIKNIEGWRRTEWWTCDTCGVVFSDDDIVMFYRDKEDESNVSLFCPLSRETVIKKLFYRKKTSEMCKTKLKSGSKGYFEKNYILDEM